MASKRGTTCMGVMGAQAQQQHAAFQLAPPQLPIAATVCAGCNLPPRQEARPGHGPSRAPKSACSRAERRNTGRRGGDGSWLLTHDCDRPMVKERPTRPMVGRRPVRPFLAEGLMMEPEVSEPMAKGTAPAETAEPGPGAGGRQEGRRDRQRRRCTAVRACKAVQYKQVDRRARRYGRTHTRTGRGAAGAVGDVPGAASAPAPPAAAHGNGADRHAGEHVKR